MSLTIWFIWCKILTFLAFFEPSYPFSRPFALFLPSLLPLFRFHASSCCLVSFPRSRVVHWRELNANMNECSVYSLMKRRDQCDGLLGSLSMPHRIDCLWIKNKSGKFKFCETYQREAIFLTTDIYVRKLLGLRADFLICIDNWLAGDMLPWWAIYL